MITIYFQCRRNVPNLSRFKLDEEHAPNPSDDKTGVLEFEKTPALRGLSQASLFTDLSQASSCPEIVRKNKCNRYSGCEWRNGQCIDLHSFCGKKRSYQRCSRQIECQWKNGSCRVVQDDIEPPDSLSEPHFVYVKDYLLAQDLCCVAVENSMPPSLWLDQNPQGTAEDYCDELGFDVDMCPCEIMPSRGPRYEEWCCNAVKSGRSPAWYRGNANQFCIALGVNIATTC